MAHSDPDMCETRGRWIVSFSVVVGLAWLDRAKLPVAQCLVRKLGARRLLEGVWDSDDDWCSRRNGQAKRARRE